MRQDFCTEYSAVRDEAPVDNGEDTKLKSQSPDKKPVGNESLKKSSMKSLKPDSKSTSAKPSAKPKPPQPPQPKPATGKVSVQQQKHKKLDTKSKLKSADSEPSQTAVTGNISKETGNKKDEDEAVQLFKKLDADGSGNITLEEFRKGLKVIRSTSGVSTDAGDVEIPFEFNCPLTCDIMVDPVINENGVSPLSHFRLFNPVSQGTHTKGLQSRSGTLFTIRIHLRTTR